jgi:guanylate kinase
MRGTLFIVAAPSGAGKSSIVNACLARDPNICLSISYTTRAPRPGEHHAEHYNFIGRDEFQRMIDAGDFFEYALVHGDWKGTAKRAVESRLAEGRDVLLEIDWQGAQQVRKLFPHMVGIFIMPPSLSELRRRLQRRGKDAPETIERRLAGAREDISHVLEFEYIIVNESFDSAATDLHAVVRATRVSRAQQESRLEKLVTEFK